MGLGSKIRAGRVPDLPQQLRQARLAGDWTAAADLTRQLEAQALADAERERLQQLQQVADLDRIAAQADQQAQTLAAQVAAAIDARQAHDQQIRSLRIAQGQAEQRAGGARQAADDLRRQLQEGSHDGSLHGHAD